jgi:hypothetical protein
MPSTLPPRFVCTLPENKHLIPYYTAVIYLFLWIHLFYAYLLMFYLPVQDFNYVPENVYNNVLQIRNNFPRCLQQPTSVLRGVYAANRTSAAAARTEVLGKHVSYIRRISHFLVPPCKLHVLPTPP